MDRSRIKKQIYAVSVLTLLFLINPFRISAQNSVRSPRSNNFPIIETWNFWQYEDLKNLDSWGDAFSDDNDIIAVYEKEEEDGFYFRADLMNLQVEPMPLFYFAIDFQIGGNTLLESGNASLISDIDWDILVTIPDTNTVTIYDPVYTMHPEYSIGMHVDLQLDYVEFGLSKDAFPGVDNSTIHIQVFSVNEAKNQVFDRSQPVSTTDSTGRARLVISFMNGFIGYGPNAVSWYDGFALRPGERPGERRGFRYILDAVEAYKVPLTINDLRIEQLPGNEYLYINQRIRDLYDDELMDPLTTLTYGHFMPWQPDDVDGKAIEIAVDLRQNLQLPVSDVFSPYEAMLTAGDVDVIKDAGFDAIYGLDQYRYWMGWIDNWSDLNAARDDVESLRKIHKINGIKFFFHTGIGNYQGFVADERWESIDWGTWSEYVQYEGTDKGLDLWWRRILLDMALDEDQEQFWCIGTDILLTPWLFQDVVDWNIRWLACHPWIEVTTFSDLLERNWSVIDHGDLGLASDELLIQYPLPGDMHYNAYFPQFYYGGISDGHSPLIPAGVEIESYFDYVPYLIDNTLIPSSRNMGDDATPGTIIYETLHNLRDAPENDLTLLAWLSYFLDISEQTFHTGQYLSLGAKLKANYVSHVNKIIAAAEWADEAANGTATKATQILAQDLDLDGEDETIIQNDKVFALFENDGGRLEYAFAWSEEKGPVQVISPINQYFLMDDGWGWTYQDGETATAPSWNRAPDTAFIQSNGSTWDYDYSLFDVTVNGDSLNLTSQDGHISKTVTLEENTIHCHYTLSGTGPVEIGMGLTVNMMNMFEMDWTENIEAIEESGLIGWKTSSGGLVLLGSSGAGVISQNSFLDSPARDELQERDSDDEEYPIGHNLFYPYHCISLYGENDFTISLTLQSDLSTAVQRDDMAIPSSILLYQNYPNPFNSETTIRYDLPQPGRVTLKIYDCLGRRVSLLTDEQLQNPGYHRTTLNMDNASSGIYFIQMTVRWENGKDTMLKQKMVLLK